jgi:hypothetical protein
MLSIYGHRLAGTLFFANAVLNVSPYLVRQSSVLLLDRHCKVVGSYEREWPGGREG